MKLIFYFALIIFIGSCAPTTQVFETKNISPMKVEGSNYTFENDTVKIVYTFWANRGNLSYTVFNKLDVPLYIDWKKSSYVKNSQKLDYWIDASTTMSVKSRNSLNWGSIYGSSYNNSTTVKPEQIVFIAPKSLITKDQFILWSGSKPNISKNPMSIGGKKIKYIEYVQNNSPLIFRNFITISTSDKFEKETYVDNGFFVSKISEMKENDFRGRHIIEKRVATYELPFKSGENFYINKTK